MASKKIKKSAASVKPVKMNAETTNVDPRDCFDDAKKGILIIIDAQIRNCNRVDNLADTYSEMREWDKDVSVSDAQDVCDMMVATYEDIKTIVENLEFEDFSNEEYSDPVADLVPTRFGIEDPVELYFAWVKWQCVRPIGEKLEQLRMTVVSNVPF